MKIEFRGSISSGGFRGGPRRGFTLIEVLVVLVLLGFLAGMGVSTLRSAQEQSRRQRARLELGLLTQALEDFRRSYGDYPYPVSADPAETALDLFTALAGDSGPAGVGDGLIGASVSGDTGKASLVDPWGQSYRYYYRMADDAGAWAVSGYILYSCGPDGRDTLPDPHTGLAVSASASVNRDNLVAEVPWM